MISNVYVNLPVADLARLRAFFEGLGFSFNDQFCDDTALAMTINDTTSAMFLTHAKFRQFTPKPVADAHEASGVLIALQMASKAEVDRITEAALAGGGSKVRDADDHGFMYARAFADPDGHIWEPLWMNMGGES